MSFKIAFIGAGSIEFTRRLVRDLLSIPEFSSVELAFMDIDPANLERVEKLCRRDIEFNRTPCRLTTTVDRLEALRDARYIILTTRIGGVDALFPDIEIPLRYGVDQCIGDTLCAGGIMYGQRGIAFLLELCRDIREVASPNALLLNYTNPMAMNTWAANTFGKVNTVGLCHGVQHSHHQVAEVLGLPQGEVDVICAGINHQTWFVQVEHKGISQLDRLLEAFERHPEHAKMEPVRIDMLRRFGYYSTESNGHLSEYLPWYRKRLEDIERWSGPGVWINGETGGYLRYSVETRHSFDTDFPVWLEEPPKAFDYHQRSVEHGSYIIEALETDRIYRGCFNRINHTTIPNLPPDCVIEAPGYVDRLGIHMAARQPLPLGCAAVCQSSIQVQRLAVQAAVHGDLDALRQAMLLDPLVSAVCTTGEVWQMVDELLVAHEAWLPQYSKEIQGAKDRLAHGPRIPYRNPDGPARLAERRKTPLPARSKS